jgi:hypothetical protein
VEILIANLEGIGPEDGRLWNLLRPKQYGGKNLERFFNYYLASLVRKWWLFFEEKPLGRIASLYINWRTTLVAKTSTD